MLKQELIKSIIRANYFYRIGTPIVPDYAYDKMIESLKEIDPDNNLLSHIGYQVDSRKAELPIPMASMNKLKDIQEINDWARLKSIPKNTALIITPKYDGISLCLDETHQLAYTRGDGKVGQVSTLHYDIMKNKLKNENDIEFTFGEAIMPKKEFLDNYSGEYANARNLVSGLFNSKEPSDILKDCVYIKYGANGHDYNKKSELLDRLNKCQQYKVPYVMANLSDFNEDMIMSLFKEWSTEFEIDGLIVEVDDFSTQETLGRETSTNNPVWARAIKYKGFEASAKTVVRNIVWNISKNGHLKPTINVDAVSLDGVVISNVTGNNARYIKEMGIGIGSEVTIVRSGMVIPVITEVLTKMPFLMPDVDNITWSESGVELITLSETDDQIVKKVVSFFQILEAVGVSEGVIKQLMTCEKVKYHDFNSALKSIFQLEVDDMSSIYRFGKKKSISIYNSIRASVKDVGIAKLQHATGVFENLGSKKLELLKHFGYRPTVSEVMNIDGFAEKSATVYVNNWVKFYNFISDLPITIKNNVEETYDDLKGLSYCFTGVRLPKIEELITSRGGKISSGVSKNTSYLVVKTKGTGSTKEQKAIELGIEILDVEQLEKKLYKS